MFEFHKACLNNTSVYVYVLAFSSCSQRLWLTLHIPMDTTSHHRICFIINQLKTNFNNLHWPQHDLWPSPKFAPRCILGLCFFILKVIAIALRAKLLQTQKRLKLKPFRNWKPHGNILFTKQNSKIHKTIVYLEISIPDIGLILGSHIIIGYLI